MSDLIKSLVRTAVQLGWGVVVSWLAVRHLDVPETVTNWLTDTVVALVMLTVTAVIRAMEAAPVDSAGGRLLRWIAKVVMLGAHWRPKYPSAPIAGRSHPLTS